MSLGSQVEFLDILLRTVLRSLLFIRHEIFVSSLYFLSFLPPYTNNSRYKRDQVHLLLRKRSSCSFSILHLDSFFHRDIGLILSEEERLPCTFKSDAVSLGHLDTSTQSTERDDLKEGTRVELPLWIAQPLSLKRMVDVSNPKHYGER